MGVPVFSGWLTFSGRRNRLSFFWIFLLFLAIDILLVVLLLTGSFGSATWLYFVLQVPRVFFFCILAAQRLRDFGLTGWLVLLFIPLAILDRYIYVATLVAMIIVLVIPGTRGDNRYGPDPLSLDVPPDGPVSHDTHPSPAHPMGTAPSFVGMGASAAGPQASGVIAELERLDGLRKSGAISAEEFERLKRKIVDASA